MNEAPSTPSAASPSPEKDYLELVHALDPFGIGASFLQMEKAWFAHPLELAAELTRFSGDLVGLQMHVWKRAFGMAAEDVAPPHADDKRFADPAWSNYVIFPGMRPK